MFAAVAVSAAVVELIRCDIPKSIINGVPVADTTTLSYSRINSCKSEALDFTNSFEITVNNVLVMEVRKTFSNASNLGTAEIDYFPAS